jgi:TolA-binding protein
MAIPKYVFDVLQYQAQQLREQIKDCDRKIADLQSEKAGHEFERDVLLRQESEIKQYLEQTSAE